LHLAANLPPHRRERPHASGLAASTTTAAPTSAHCRRKRYLCGRRLVLQRLEFISQRAHVLSHHFRWPRDVIDEAQNPLKGVHSSAFLEQRADYGFHDSSGFAGAFAALGK